MDSNHRSGHFNQCIYAFFDRHGGRGQPPFASRNVSYGVGDDDEVVRHNRELVQSSLGLERLVSARQIHGDRIFCYIGDMPKENEIDGVDALITQQRGIGLMIQQADCQAVLLHDPIHQAVGAIHCGWRGSVNGIIGKTVSAMREHFGTNPADLLAIISPSLGPCCAEFVNFRDELPKAFLRFRVSSTHFDFWQITSWQLQENGVPESAITAAKVCTACSPDYFSYRRACKETSGSTGRNCSVIALPMVREY